MVKSLVQQHSLIAFFVLAFAISWLFGAPAVLFPNWPGLLVFLTAIGPALAAIIIAAIVDGKVGLEKLLLPLKKWRVGPQWYLIVLFGPAITMIVSIVLYDAFRSGENSSGIEQIRSMIGGHFIVLLAIFFYQFSIVWGEEIGWRGYALPRLQNTYHPILASVILGVLWGLWHLPSFWMDGSVHQSMSVLFFIFATIGYSILYTWIYNGTGGSLLLICLLHAANNTTVSYTMLFFKPILEEPIFSLLILGLFDAIVIVLAGPKLRR